MTFIVRNLLSLYTCDPLREALPLDCLIRAEDETSALARYGLHQTLPRIACVSSWCEPQVDALAVDGVAEERHVILPADGAAHDDPDALDVRDHGLQRRRLALRPHEALRARRHHLSPLPDDPTHWINVQRRAIQAPAGLLDRARHDEHAGVACDVLKEFARAVPSPPRLLVHRQLVLNPIIPSPVWCVPKINRRLAVREELVPSMVGSCPNRRSKAARPWVPAQVRFWEQEDRNPLLRRLLCRLPEGRQCSLQCPQCVGLRNSDFEL